jgi:hypothetical protein
VSVLFAAFTAASIAPGASAAEPVSEVAAAAGSTVETVTAPPPAPAPAPQPSAAPAPAPAPTPAAVTEPVTATVERSLGSSSSGSAVSHVAGEATRQSTETVAAVAESSGAADAPIVRDLTRGAGAAASAVVATDAGDAGAAATPSHGSADPTGPGDRAADKRAARPAGHGGQIGPPAPPTATNTFALPSPPQGIDLTAAPRHAPDGTAIVPAGAAGEAADFLAPADRAEETGGNGAAAHEVPIAPPSLDASASPLSGSGFGPALILLGLLTLFVLLAPRTPARLLSAGRIHRSAPFICALERPG